MEMRRQSKEPMQEASSAGPSSSLGWPFGLPTCMDIHTPSRKESAETPLAFHQQFLNLQTTFLLPFFSDVDGGSSTSDTDSRSEAASSFFKDSRRITLGSLIGLPMDTSFRAMQLDAHYNVFSGRRRNFLPSCGMLELLGCARNSSAISFDFDATEDGEDDTVVTASSRSLAASSQLEGSVSQGTDPSDPARSSTVFEDALSTGSRSPDWNDQFVSCHSILCDGEWTGADTGRHGSGRIATPMSLSVRSTPRHKSLNSQKIQRSSSVVENLARAMNDPNTVPILSPENAVLSQNLRMPRASARPQSSSGTTGTSNIVRGSAEAVGDMIAARLTSLVEDCIQQVMSIKQLVKPFNFEIEGSSAEITERLHQSRKQAVLRKDELEAERQKVHQAACQVINVLNDTMEGLHDS